MKTKALNSEDTYLFEEQSSTLPVWWSRRDKPRTVICLDAHLDLQQTAPRAIQALLACTTVDEVSALEAPHHLNTSPDYAFAADNYLYAASRLGLIERLIWVAPPHVPRGYSADMIDYLQRIDGIGFDELTGFEETGANTMRGKLLGLDITICDYDRLGSLDLGNDYYLDIDIDYFIKVPEDRLWIEPAIVISKIVDQLGEPSLVTIARSVVSGYTPLAFRYIGDYIYSRFCRQSEQFEYYWRLSGAIRKLSRGKKKAGRQICETLAASQPDNAAAWYLLALTAKESAERNRLLDEASRRDEKYRPDLARDASGILHRRKPFEQKRLRQLSTALDKLELDPGERELSEIALARTLAAAGNMAEAEGLLLRQSGALADHDDVLLALAATQLEDRDRYHETWNMLVRICDGYRNVTTAHMYLGELESAAGNHEAALVHFRDAQMRAPASMAPLKALVVTYQQLLMQREYDQTKQEIVRREQRLRRLLTGD